MRSWESVAPVGAAGARTPMISWTIVQAAPWPARVNETLTGQPWTPPDGLRQGARRDPIMPSRDGQVVRLSRTVMRRTEGNRGGRGRLQAVDLGPTPVTGVRPDHA